MHSALKKYSSLLLISLALLLFLVLFFFFGSKSYGVFILAFLVLIIFLSVLLNDYTKILFLLILTIPLSVPLSSNGFTILVASEILIAFLALFAVIHYGFTAPINKKVLNHPVSILILIDLLWNFICAFLSDSPEVAFKRTIVSSVYILVYYFLLTELFSDFKNISKIYTLYTIGLIIPIVYTLYIHARLNFTVSGAALLSRPFYNDHTVYGAVLAFFIPYLIYFTVKKSNGIRSTLFYFILTALFSVGLFFSYSRAAWLSLLISGLFFIFINTRYKLLLSSSLVIMALIVAIFFGESIYKTILESKAISNKEDVTEHVRSVTNVNSDVSNAERINRWRCALRMFYDKPLTGFGPGTYQFYYGNYQLRTEMTRISTFKGDKGHSHSEYLNRLSETGAPGLLLFISIACSVFFIAWRVQKNILEPSMNNIIKVSVLGLITFYVHAFFNGFIETDKMAMPVYAAIAAIVAIDIQTRESASKIIAESH